MRLTRGVRQDRRMRRMTGYNLALDRRVSLGCEWRMCLDACRGFAWIGRGAGSLRNTNGLVCDADANPRRFERAKVG